jgi:hypothetical protein
VNGWTPEEFSHNGMGGLVLWPLAHVGRAGLQGIRFSFVNYAEELAVQIKSPPARTPERADQEISNQ